MSANFGSFLCGQQRSASRPIDRSSDATRFIRSIRTLLAPTGLNSGVFSQSCSRSMQQERSTVSSFRIQLLRSRYSSELDKRWPLQDGFRRDFWLCPSWCLCWLAKSQAVLTFRLQEKSRCSIVQPRLQDRKAASTIARCHGNMNVRLDDWATGDDGKSPIRRVAWPT
ncbi:unnamed protein product [Protopolystoma xenopodis]|uniref:Uncharacterized protein n=1 Tax=Protopolystoma xenopodis TaxID=117903 RepID=A0A3S4ZXP2_9PLAT|nr:unnamed protein product [Protopolystoma xenopodis]